METGTLLLNEVCLNKNMYDGIEKKQESAAGCFALKPGN